MLICHLNPVKKVISMKFYLGIVGLGQDNAAAAIVNEYGQVIAAAEEERYTRVKLDSSFPINSIKFCLDTTGIGIEEVTEIGYYFSPNLYRKERIFFALKNTYHLPSLLRKSVKFAKFYLAKQIIRKELKYKGPISFIQHHLCHAASVFFASSFPEATIVSIDGVGEWETAWIGYGKGGNITHIESTLWPNSLGEVYAAFTQFLGFNYNFDEYKVMGLSAYGSPSYYGQFMDVLKVLGNGKFAVNESYFCYHYGKDILFSGKCEKLFGKPNKKFTEPSERDKNLAASLQKRTEDCFLAYVSRAVRLTGIRNVCIAGGVALNCVAIGKIIKNRIADSIYLGPASSDAGCALGAAYYLARIRSEKYMRHPLKNAYLGNSFTDGEIKKSLDQFNLNYTDYGDKITDVTAELIAKGKIVGWFQGRTEYGQRALGARSILANPTIPDMKQVINEKVKFRELFRPLAPSVLKEATNQYFDCNGHLSPFMTHTFTAKPEVSKKIPAVIHIDGTARVQTVTKEENGNYYELIKKVGEKTGHPVVLNTSFNIKGEPIVNSPEDAISCFLKTELE